MMEAFHRLEEEARDLTLLYVDDEREIREEMARMLRRYFSVVETAGNGMEGYKLFELNRHDIIITDIRMPEMDGVEMSQKIRGIEPEQVVVVISAYDFSDRLAPFLKKEADGFLLKPVSHHDLVQTLITVAQKAKNKKNGILPTPMEGAPDEERIRKLEERVHNLEGELTALRVLVEKMSGI